MPNTPSPSSPFLPSQSPEGRMKAWKQLLQPRPSWEEFKRMSGRGMSSEQIVKAVARKRKKQAAASLSLDEERSLLTEFLCDQETLNEPFRNESLCEKARKFLGVTAG